VRPLVGKNLGRVLSKPEPRAGLILSQLVDQMKMPASAGEIRRYARLRNFILDVVAEGRRKAIINLVMEADARTIRDHIAAYRASSGEQMSLTAYIAKSFACAVAEDRRMQAYRLGRSRLILFDDVDLAMMVEREWDEATLPVFHIVRAAQGKSVAAIHRELQNARAAPLGRNGPMQAFEMWFFLLPRALRRIVWFMVRRNPYWFKDVAGTAGVTSMGMFTSGAAVVQPITPMTLTLSIGAIECKPVLRDGEVTAGEVIHFNLGADHAVIDGAPLMRFADRFKAILADGIALATAPGAATIAQRPVQK
jgi:pyruvate/2-oxoglutarate dehydrogenase complex dihydrolipoamide acyltransferase (E2) component